VVLTSESQHEESIAPSVSSVRRWMKKLHLQCFDTVGWASGRASGL